MGSYYDRSDAVIVDSPPAQRSRIDQDSNPIISSNRIHVGLPGRRPSEPIGLDKLLGPGSNDLLDQCANNYEDLLKKWSECSVDEWKAGAEGGQPSPFSSLMTHECRQRFLHNLLRCLIL